MKKDNVKRVLIASLCACMVLAGCGSNGKNKSGDLETGCKKAASFVDYAYERQQGNTLVSPLSLDLALGMLAEGASGETAEELNRYLDRENSTAWAKDYLKYARKLKSGPTSKSGYAFSFKLGNSVWVNKDYKVTEDYRKLMEETFLATVQNADFAGEPQKAMDLINEWCDKNTDGMVKEIVSPDQITNQTAAALLNVVYFESPWEESWREESGVFTDFSGEETEVTMLSSDETMYYENEKAKAFGKPYKEGFLFIGILPKKTGEFTLEELELKSLLDSVVVSNKFIAEMPQLDLETDLDLIDMLKERGVERAFDRVKADFGRMFEKEGVFVSSMIQKCQLQLDKDGTRAGAATSELLTFKSLPQRLSLTRPFAFLIYDTNKDEIVFAGKVVTVK